MHQSVVMLNEGRPVTGERGGRGVEALAGQVIAMLRMRDGRTMPLDDRRIDELADRLIAAALAPEAEAVPAYAAAARGEGVSVDTLIDCVMPVAARELGRAWEDDRLSFVHVTLAMARIQRLLRDALVAAPMDGPGILFVLPEGEQHTLGGLVAVRQLRRMGVSACLCLGEKPRMVADMLRARRFDALFLSVATAQGLESACGLITFLRTESVLALPVVIGGAMLCGTEQAEVERVRAATGAAVVSNDLASVLARLKLSPKETTRAETA